MRLECFDLLIGHIRQLVRPLGAVTEARARIVLESEADHASSIVASNWSTPMRLFERFLDRTRVPLAYVAITPSAFESSAPTSDALPVSRDNEGDGADR